MSWENNDMNIFNNRTIQREKFFIEKECENEENKECQITKELTPTPSELSTTSNESTTPTKD